MKHKLHALLASVRGNFEEHRKIWIACSVVIFVILAIILTMMIFTSDESVDRTAPDVTVSASEPEIITATSPLTGLEVSPEEAARPVTAIVIENSPEARPQSSLHEAGLVFESIAEGGITRYLAFYQETQPDVIGPIRSLRPYFIDWVQAFDANIVHFGGSATALQEAKDLKLRDIDLITNDSAYYRVNFRYAPHNAYSDFDTLNTQYERFGYDSESDFEAWPRKAAEPLTTPKARKITLNISSITYQSIFTYNKKSNTYLHTIGGSADKDRETNKRVAPVAVVVIEAENRVVSNGRYEYDLIGKGKATVFQDGDVVVGTWKKNARDAQFTFTTDNGDEIAFNPGQIWVTAISPDQEPEYTR